VRDSVCVVEWRTISLVAQMTQIDHRYIPHQGLGLLFEFTRVQSIQRTRIGVVLATVGNDQLEVVEEGLGAPILYGAHRTVSMRSLQE